MIIRPKSANIYTLEKAVKYIQTYFERISYIALVFSLLTLNRYMFVGKDPKIILQIKQAALEIKFPQKQSPRGVL